MSCTVDIGSPLEGDALHGKDERPDSPEQAPGREHEARHETAHQKAKVPQMLIDCAARCYDTIGPGHAAKTIV